MNQTVDRMTAMPSVLAEQGQADGAYTDVAILSTTDMHGKCWDTNLLTLSAVKNNMLRVSTAVNRIRTEFGPENVLLIDNGDLFQGTPVSQVQLFRYFAGSSDLPPAMALCLSRIGYDAFVLGNHEFNYEWRGMNAVYDWLEDSGVPVLAANVYYDGSDGVHIAGENAFTPYVIKTITVNGHDHRIGILGIENTDITRWDLPINYPGLQFIFPGNDKWLISADVRKYLDRMKAEGCEFIIASCHSGLGSADGAVTFGVNSQHQGLRLIRETDNSVSEADSGSEFNAHNLNEHLKRATKEAGSTWIPLEEDSFREKAREFLKRVVEEQISKVKEAEKAETLFDRECREQREALEVHTRKYIEVGCRMTQLREFSEKKRGRVSLVKGRQGIGKSTLLKACASRFPEQYIGVFTDLQGDRGSVDTALSFLLESLYRRGLIKRMTPKNPGESSAGYFERQLEGLRGKTEITLIIDCAEQIYDFCLQDESLFSMELPEGVSLLISCVDEGALSKTDLLYKPPVFEIKDM